MITVFDKNVKLERLTLFLTDVCNMRCSYCFEDHCGTKTYMNTETVDKVFELIKDNVIEYTRVDIFGGEPTLNMGTFEHIAHRCVEYGIGNIRVYSNGFINDERIVNLYKYLSNKLNLKVTISVDAFGDLGIHDRLDIGGGSTYDRVVCNVHTLRQHGINVAVNRVLTPSNIAEIPNYIKHCMDNGVTIYDPMWIHIDCPEVDDFSVSDFASMTRQFIDHWDMYGYDDVLNSVFGRIMPRKIINELTLDSILTDEDKCAHCLMNGDEMAILANGQILPCRRFVNHANRVNCVNVGDIDISEPIKFTIDGIKHKSQCTSCNLHHLCTPCDINYTECNNDSRCNRAEGMATMRADILNHVLSKAMCDV